MNTFKVWHIIGLSAALLMPLLSDAQQNSAPADTPPQKKLEKLDEGEPPSVKIGKPENKRSITETQTPTGGRVTKVQGALGTYYVKPNEPVGSSLPGDAQSSANKGAEWKVLEFDLGSKNKKSNEEDPAPVDGGAPPPATPAKK